MQHILLAVQGGKFPRFIHFSLGAQTAEPPDGPGHDCGISDLDDDGEESASQELGFVHDRQYDPLSSSGSGRLVGHLGRLQS
ncbi:MAG TPA: hypothetical protein PK156_49065, partial [Polyangium sp.]|nr:hypothetical protein [Polyangium sp.]